MTLQKGIAVLLLLALVTGCAAPAAPNADANAVAPVVLEAMPDASETALPALPEAASAAQTGLEAVPPSAADPATLCVLFINVGKADAALVQYGGQSALIDTGTKESAPRLLGALSCMGVTALDALFLTHTHSDHIGGMRALSANLPVRQAYAAHISEDKKNGGNKITERANECNVPLTRLSAGDTVPLSGGVSFEVVGPLIRNDADDNDNSLVLRLTANGRTLLFTGDMQFAEEDTLLAGGASLLADVLKVGNHGNPDATGDAFAAAVSPRLAVISTDTAEDDDSANPRVYAALSMADIRVTQDCATGVLLTVSHDGALALSDPVPPASALRLSVTNKDVSAQTVTVHNDGDAADIGGCMLFSERGGELFRFPAGARLGAGESVTVSGMGGGGDYAFTDESAPWHMKKADAAVLYDPFGRVLARG